METLAYLHLAEDYESTETKQFNLKGVTTAAMIGAIGAASVVGGVVGTADSASAYGYGGGYYGGCYGGCGYNYYSYHRPYYPRYYSYRHHRPCNYWY